MFYTKKNWLYILFLATYTLCNATPYTIYSEIIPQEILELIQYFKDNNNILYNRYSIELPRGILILGQPGSGKTTIAKKISAELNITYCPVLYRSAAELDSDNIKELFYEARTAARNNRFKKSIIFIDDFNTFSFNPKLSKDAIALLNEMDGFKTDNTVIVIAASNPLDNFDKSVIRSGRFEKVIEIGLPNPTQREAILKAFNQGSALSYDPALNLANITRLTYNFTPADLRSLINYAHSNVKKDTVTLISERQMLEAIIKVLQSKNLIDKNLNVRIKVIMALLNKKNNEKKGFASLIGEVPAEIKEVVQQIKNNSLYKTFKLELPKGILLVGPPGSGKTSLIRALAQEADCEFMAISAGEFSDQFVGAGAQKIREFFKEGRQKAAQSESKKTILFIDELDSIGKRQGNSLDSTITELLTQMDGFEEDDSIIVIAATNNPQNIDQALLRPGRFSKTIKIGLPDLTKRELLLQFYTTGIPLFSDVNLKKIAQATNNFSPADLKELVQKTSSLALKENSQQLKEKHFVDGIKKALTEKILKGQKDIQQQIDLLDVLFNGKETEKGFKRIVGGIEPAINDLVRMIKGELDFSRFGIPFPKGILLVGPPGTGKTALARAIAEETGCEFIQAKGSDFIEMFVGVGAQRVRELFNEAHTRAEGNRFGKTIIFIDEIDAIGSRGNSLDGGETNRTITELLTQMDGFYKDDSIIILAATNTPALLDPALLRAGRFDTIIEIPLPNLAKRKAILEYYCKNRPVDSAVSFDKFALAMEGFNAADIKNLVDKAALFAMKVNQGKITESHFDEALNIIKSAENKKQNTYLPI